MRPAKEGGLHPSAACHSEGGEAHTSCPTPGVSRRLILQSLILTKLSIFQFYTIYTVIIYHRLYLRRNRYKFPYWLVHANSGFL